MNEKYCSLPHGIFVDKMEILNGMVFIAFLEYLFRK